MFLQVICTLGYHLEVLPTSELHLGSSSAHPEELGDPHQNLLVLEIQDQIVVLKIVQNIHECSKHVVIQIQLTTVHKCPKNLIKHVVHFDQPLGFAHPKQTNPSLNLLFPSF